MEDTGRDETFVGDSGGGASSTAANPGAEGGNKDEVPAKDDDATTAAVLPPVSSEEAANSTQESGGKAIDPTNHLLSKIIVACLSFSLSFVCFPVWGRGGDAGFY